MITTSPTFVFPPMDALPTRLLTVEDLAALPSELPSGPVNYELDNGRIVVMAPPGDVHGASQLNLGTELKVQGERRGHGKARTEVGVIVRRNPDHVLCPDAVFIASCSLPIRCSKEGYLETIPDLVVEVRSKNDSRTYLDRKVADYLAAGVVVVWVADPASGTITIHRSNSEPQVLSGDQQLTADRIIPDFSVQVADIFKV